MEYVSVGEWAVRHGVFERTPRRYKEYMIDTCLSEQDDFKILIDKFRIHYD